jgi:hypothetical protein
MERTHCSLLTNIALRIHRHISAYFSSLTLHTVVLSTLWPLLGWRRNGQETLHLCQKHLLWREHMVSQCHAGSRFQTARRIDRARQITHQTSVRSIVQMELKSLCVMRCFWNGDNTVGAACAVLPLYQLATSTPHSDQVYCRDEYGISSRIYHTYRTLMQLQHCTSRQHLLRIAPIDDSLAVKFELLPQECGWLVSFRVSVCVRLGDQIVIGILSGVIEYGLVIIAL